MYMSMPVFSLEVSPIIGNIQGLNVHNGPAPAPHVANCWGKNKARLPGMAQVLGPGASHRLSNTGVVLEVGWWGSTCDNIY